MNPHRTGFGNPARMRRMASATAMAGTTGRK